MAGRCGCQRTCSCCTTESDTISVGGSGSAGQCFQSSVKISPTAGNLLVSEGSAGLAVLLCARLPNGDAAAITEEGCIQIPPTVVLDYDGNAIPPNGDGEIPLPTGGLPPAYGCGLQTDGDGVLSVKTSGAWPGDDLSGASFEGAYTEGSEIYCGPDGKIRGVPQATAITAGLAETVLPDTLVAVPAAYNSAASGALAVTNPSLARSMILDRFVNATVDIVIPPNGAADVILQERIDGGAWSSVKTVSPAEPSGGAYSARSTVQLSSRLGTTIGPGDGQTLELRVRIEKTGSGDDPVLVGARVGARILGVSK